ncbi:scaffolding protein [Aeromonas phage MJG]|uniref:Scaffolding protein n=1 Tax=Aeromonas phage MJG TaxID=2510451 RepID=A0A5J6A0T9_9CAUD|nr:scaffolding protein [Aeromonas phage MJG]
MSFGVEIIENSSVVDLTGNGGKEPIVEPVVEDTNPAPTDADPAPTDPAPNPDGESNPAPAEEPAPDDAPVVEMYFGGERVDVEVPEEVNAALAEAGVDSKALLAELFDKEGKFELSADTRSKLEAKYGKLMVDGYLNMYRTQNQQTLEKYKQEQSAQEQSTKAIQEEYVSIVGGEEGLAKLEDYVLKTFDEKQIATYNAVMSGDSWEAQKMILNLVKGQMETSIKQATGDTNIKLLGDGDANATVSDPVLDKGFITSAEYQQMMDSDKYWDDKEYQRKVDSLRARSIQAGR